MQATASRHKLQQQATSSRLVAKDAPRTVGKVGYHTSHIKQPHTMKLGVDLIRFPLWLLLLLFFLANVLCVVVFAALYYAADEGCFVASSTRQGFSFVQMLWLSVHIFTTVGFGSIYPEDACIMPNLLTFVEHFIGVLDIAVFTAILISKLTQPSPVVRFSEKFLVSHDEEQRDSWLTFRMVRESMHKLRDCRIRVQCGLINRDADGEISGCSEETLSLVCAEKSNLETWFVRHRIDGSSPLSQERLKDLAFLNVSLTVFDTAHAQEVRLYHSYTPGRDMVRNATFDVMKSWLAHTTVREERRMPALEVIKNNWQTLLKRMGSSVGLTEAGELHADDSFVRGMILSLDHVVDHSKLNAYTLLPV